MSAPPFSPDGPLRPTDGVPLSRLRVAIATLFGVGRFPIAPGTAGSAASLPLVWILALGGSQLYAAATGAVILLAIWASEAAESRFAVKDPKPVVIDETAGQLVTFAFLPLGPLSLAAGFFLFRVFDVVKPFPARRFERIRGGAGIVLDDVVAGIYANLALRAGVRLLEEWRA